MQATLVELMEKLNEQQRMIVESDGNILVIAGPGSGKTFTLAVRSAFLINHRNINEDNIVLLTFTKKAANEIQRRVSKTTGKKIKATTFHAYCYNSIVKRPGLFGELSDYNIMDEDESFDLFSNSFSEDYKREMIKTGFSIELIWHLYEMSRHKMIDFSGYLSEYLKDAPDIFDIVSKIASDAIKKYKIKKNKNKRMDYNDILEFYLEALVNKDVFRLEEGGDLYLMVDEYQDTNRIQFLIIKHLANVNNQCMVVGDDCQSIYKFRGANYENILYYKEEINNVKVMFLTYNYRSSNEVIETSNVFLSKMSEIFYPKKILPVRNTEGFVTKIVFRNRYDQYNFVHNKILEYIDYHGVAPSDIAIIFRANHESYELENMLMRSRISYVKYGGQKFLEQAHLKDIVSVITLLMNEKDEVSLLRILKKIKGIGDITAQKIINEIEEGKIILSDPKTISSPVVPKNAFEELLRYSQFIKKYKETHQNYSVHHIVTEAISVAKNMLEKYEKNSRRVNSLRQFLEISKWYSNIKSFLDSLRLDESIQEDSDNKLVLSTIHSAKGLEFKVVFVINVYDNNIPKNSDPEEQRLFYVAITRAKDDLYICTTMSNDGMSKSIFCEMLDNIEYTFM